MRPALALFPAVLLVACATPFAERYAAGNGAMSTGAGAGYLVAIGPRLQRALNTCIPAGTKGASPTLVLVADVDASGQAGKIDIEPDGPGTQCVMDDLASSPLPRPPLAAGAASLPLGLRIETR